MPSCAVVRELGVDYAQGYRVAHPERIPGHGPARAEAVRIFSTTREARVWA